MVSDRPEFVFRHKRRVWAILLFLLACLATAWFTYVLYGEQQAFTDDPGRWAYTATINWAIGGAVLFALVAIYFLLLLVRKEVPAQTYVLTHEGDATAGSPETVTASTQAPQ